MSARARRPTDDAATGVYDPDRQRALLKPPLVGAATPMFESFEQDVTEVTPIPGTQQVIEDVAPAPRGPSPHDAARFAVANPPGEPAAPERRRGLERSEPLRVISMKDHTEAQKPRSDDARAPRQVQLRSMAEVTGRNDTPVRLGNLAPPRDPRQARARRRRDNVVWACVAIALAGALALAIWLVAGR